MKFLNRVKSRTPESVELEFILAGLGNRIYALVIDYLIWSSILILVLLVWSFLVTQIAWLRSEPIRLWVVAIQILMLFGVYVGYFVFFETLWRGQTPGKRYVKIRVIREDGRNVGIQQSILRSLLRPADDIFCLGFLSILFSAQEKRLGDWVAGTILIQEGQTVAKQKIEISSAATDVAQRIIETGKIAALTPDQFGVIRKYLYRYPTLAPTARTSVSNKLAAQLLQVVELAAAPPTIDAHLTIEAIYLAYQQQFRE